MSHATSSKEAAAYLIDPMNAPEPSQETGPGAHFGSTFAPASKTTATTSTKDFGSENPFRDNAAQSSTGGKSGVTSSERPLKSDYREAAFGGMEPARRRAGSQGQGAPPPSYDAATSPKASSAGKSGGHHRRSSSLKERYPGDHSHEPLDIIRRDSKKANRSPHLKKTHLPGPDMIDRLDPAVGGRAYHHEGPFDAALLARNTSHDSSPLAALKTSNDEALKATPKENIKDAVERHKPLDGTAIVPPGVPDRFGRTYNYEEGADLVHEDTPNGPGYKRWADLDYDPNDLKGESEPSYSLDRAFKEHRIDDNGIELRERGQLSGAIDERDPVHIAGDDRKYQQAYEAQVHANDSDVKRSGSLRAAGSSIKKRIGSLRHKKDD